MQTYLGNMYLGTLLEKSVNVFRFLAELFF
jgi:hypothetical protein